MGPPYGPLASLKGSELWAPIMKVVYVGAILFTNKGLIPGDHRVHFGLMGALQLRLRIPGGHSR